MNPAIVGLLTRLILGLAWASGGFEGLVITAALGIIGLVVGKVVAGDVDLGRSGQNQPIAAMNATAIDRADGPLSTSQPAASQSAASQVRGRGSPRGGRSAGCGRPGRRKATGRAVTLVSGAAAAPRRLLGMNVGQARPRDSASVTAQVEDGRACRPPSR